MNAPLARLITQPSSALPILTFPGGRLIDADVLTLVTQADAQARAQLALADRYPLPALMTCMDLSVEAEAFGCDIHLAADEVPTVTGRRVQSQADVDALEVPAIGAGRTRVYLAAAQRLRQAAGDRLVLGGMVGPFSLASRLDRRQRGLEPDAH